MFKNITKHTLTLRYAIALILICLFAGVGYLVQAYSLTDYQERQQLVNELAKQRVSVQHIAFVAQRLSITSDTADRKDLIQELDHSIRDLEQSLNHIDTRSKENSWGNLLKFLRPVSETYHSAHVLHIKAKLEEFKHHAQNVLVQSQNGVQQKDDITQLTEKSLVEINQKMDVVFSTAINEMQDRLLAFRRIELAIFLLIVFCVLIGGFFIFRPMVNAVIDYHTDLRLTRDDIEKKAQELAEAKGRAEEANAAKTDFLANISHEIRTPMGSILGYAERLLSASLASADRLRYANIIRRNGKILLDLIDDLLDISKIEAGQLEIERINVSLRQIMGEVYSLLGWRAREKGLDFNVRFESAPSQIVTDPTRLRQILINIIGNAIKFTNKGSIEVLVRTRSALYGQRRKLEIVVSDTGCGIDVDQIDKLFEPFVQADTTTTRKYGGTGLGLALSRRLARALGGDLYLGQSRRGIGSSFVAFIDPGETTDLDLNSDLEWDETKQVPSETSQDLFPERGLTGLRILIVEDGEENRDLFRYYLETAGAHVSEAMDGLDGVDKALTQEYDLVLMDIQMPRLDGFEALATLKQQGYKVPVVALTAHAMKAEKERCRQAGFLDHIGKPVTAKTLVETVQSLIGKEVIATTSSTSIQNKMTSLDHSLFEIELDFGGDVPEPIKKTINRFVENIPERVDEIKQAYEENDVERLGKLFHKIKGGAGACGFVKLMAKLNLFEDEIRKTPDLIVISRRHYQELDRVVSEARVWRMH